LASIGLTPAATTRTSSSLSTGVGTGTVTSRSTSAAPGSSKTIARICAGVSGTEARLAASFADAIAAAGIW
jgi:hypothetical protein